MFRHSNKLAVSALMLALTASLAACDAWTSHDKLLADARAFQAKHDLNAATIVLKNAAEKSPNDAETRYMLAAVYNDAGDGPSAEKEIRKAMTEGYAPDAAMPVLARAILLQGKYQRVLDDTAQAAKGGRPELLAVRGEALLALEQVDAAREIFAGVLEKNPKFLPALLGMGRAAAAQNEEKAALAFADQALAVDPNDTDALQFKGDLLRAANQNAPAMALYDKILQINPNHRLAYIEKTYVAVADGKFDQAQKFLDSAKEVTPGSLLVVYTQALLDFSQEKHAVALDSLNLVLSVAPEHMPSLLLAGAVNLHLGSLNQAENYLRQYLDKNPNNAYARKMLAATLLRSGHSPDALSVLSPALKNDKNDVQLLALAGESYMQVRDFASATEFFQQAAALNPKAAGLRTSLGLSKLGKGQKTEAIDDLQLATKLDAKSPQAGIALVRTELGLGRFERAMTAALEMESAQPDNPVVQELKGNVYLAQKKPEQARASFEKALQLKPSYFPAVSRLAALDLEDQQLDKARTRLKSFLDKNPADVDAMTMMAGLATAEKKTAEATQWLEKAVAAEPNGIAVTVRLLSQYLLIGENQKALSLARKIQVAHPENPDLLDLLGKSQLANGERSGALESYKKLALALPRSAQAHMQVAALQILMGKYSAAEDTLKTALAMQPDFPAAQLAQAELYVRKGSYALALMTASRLQTKYPKASAGYQLEADILMEEKKPALAVSSYEKAFAITKSNELMIKSVGALRASGKQQEAIRLLDQWLAGHPDDLRAQLFKAESLMADKQFKPAVQLLESTLKHHPRNVPALNNLAWAFQQMGDQRAIASAEQAFSLAGDQPEVMDTLGWILVDMGDAARGVALLQKASMQAPQARDIRYHLAVGFNKTGNKAAAKKELEQMLSGDTRFAQAEEARALLQQLQ
jgi:putative PEP-CTERM system TPR-repeat lipoprotein